MDQAPNTILKLLSARGLVSYVVADTNLVIQLFAGPAADGLSTGMRLSEAVPALFGMEAALDELREGDLNARLVLSSVALQTGDGPAERRDYVVIFDPPSASYLLLITPTFAHDDHLVELEQQDRREQLLRAQLAAQATAIRAANEALQRVNADLENFTRIISHDLKAPLRAIRYSVEDLGHSLAAGGAAAGPAAGVEIQTEALAELRGQSLRLSAMVTDLLAYSRLEVKADAIAAIDTRHLIEAIARSLPRPPALVVRLAGDWPELQTLGVLLDVVLRNLLDNAIKHHDLPAGEIIISGEMTSDAFVICVCDDGPGIPEKYRAAVLQPFVTLGADDPASSGLGLTMVAKIVKQVGGHLQIAARDDGVRGARIVVAWPLTTLDI